MARLDNREQKTALTPAASFARGASATSGQRVKNPASRQTAGAIGNAIAGRPGLCRMAPEKCPLLLVAVLCLAGCQSAKAPLLMQVPPDKSESSPASNAATDVEAPQYSLRHDKEVKQIFELAKASRWEEAAAVAEQLRTKDPADPVVIRIHDWVIKQQEILRSQKLEDTIREIDSQNSVFSPTIGGFITEQADRGLPPRKDLRDAVLDIEAGPYVPSTYNQIIERPAPLFDFKSQAGRMARGLDNKVTIKVDDVTLEHIIFQIGEEQDINFVADRSLEAFQQKLSMNSNEMRVGEFLSYVSRNFDLQFQVGDDLIWIVDGEDKQKIIEETRIYRLQKGFILPARFGADEVQRKETINAKTKDKTIETTEKAKSFVRDGVSETTSIEQAIKGFFKGSNYLINYEHNIILATGTREQLAVLERIIEEYDRPLQQVLIEARFITVSEAAFLQLGALWETGRPQAEEGQVPSDFLGFGPDNVGRSLQETFRNILDRDNLSLTLNALDQQGEIRTLSVPRITAINNRPAQISDGKRQNYYEEYTVTQTINERNIASTLVPSGTPKEITSGVSLEVMASIGGDGKTIYLALHPEVNQDVRLVSFATVADSTGNSFEIRLPESRTQSLNTRVIVQSGQTVVMGGVLEREQSTFVESVPILGKLPVIGSAFRRRTEVDKPRYLLIFVTATLLSETGEFIDIQPAAKP